MSALAFNLVAASILILLVLAVRAPVARLFGARAAFALWLAPAARLVMPPLDFARQPAPVAEENAVAWIEFTERSIAETAGWAVSNEMLVATWAIGALAMLLWPAATHLRFVADAVSGARSLEGVSGYRVIVTSKVDGPVATGLFRKLILVPSDFESRFTAEQQRFAILHEETHHRRGDLWAMAVALVVRAALWFNPLAYPAFAAFRRDMESACDASLLKAAGQSHAETYGETIVRSAARPVPQSLCALTSFEDLKRRLEMLKFTHGKGRTLAGLGVAAIVAAGGLAIAMPANADEKKGHKTIKKEIIEIEGDGNKWVEKDGAERKINCPGEMMEFAAESGDNGEKNMSKIAICFTEGDSAKKISALEETLERLDGQDEMDAGSKAELQKQIRAKIAELRS